ncbi:MAG: hypothetical protein SFY68_08675 [Candidatus Sumerlaeia bacterium]|nr:hypothetical protein [Candidatus Sumerlaeia bacterium]
MIPSSELVSLLFARDSFVNHITAQGLNVTGGFSDVGLVEHFLASLNTDEDNTVSLNNAAAFLGELVRNRFGGEWHTHRLFGLSLVNIGAVEGFVFSPLHLVEKKSELGAGLSLERVLGMIPQRIDAAKADRIRFGFSSASLEQVLERLLSGNAAINVRAALLCEELLRQWPERFGRPLVRSLVGIRELDTFLKSQHFLFSFDEELLARLGIFVGEVIRGLYGGEWTYSGTGDTEALSLEFPELALHPIGKVYKLLSIQKNGESLEEYLRLIPSARQAMRDRLGATS